MTGLHESNVAFRQVRDPKWFGQGTRARYVLAFVFIFREI